MRHPLARFGTVVVTAAIGVLVVVGIVDIVRDVSALT
jgi:hypothetical protein